MNLQRVIQENGMNSKPMNRYSVRPVEQDDVESIAMGLLYGTEDLKEGISAFLQKRKPDYKGR